MSLPESPKSWIDLLRGRCQLLAIEDPNDARGMFWNMSAAVAKQLLKGYRDLAANTAAAGGYEDFWLRPVLQNMSLLPLEGEEISGNELQFLARVNDAVGAEMTAKIGEIGYALCQKVVRHEAGATLRQACSAVSNQVFTNMARTVLLLPLTEQMNASENLSQLQGLLERFAEASEQLQFGPNTEQDPKPGTARAPRQSKWQSW